MAKYVKLGEQALSFADPTTGFKIRQGEVKEYSNKEALSKKFAHALKKGHLEKADADDFEEFQTSGNTANSKVDTSEASAEFHTAASLKKLGKDEILEMIGEFEGDHDVTGLNKPDLIELYLELQGEEEEE